MNWYKKASSNYAIWLSEAIREHTNNYTKPMRYDEDPILGYIEQWFKETNPNTNNLSLDDAAVKAIRHVNDKQSPDSHEQIRRNMNTFFAEHQNMNPNAPNFAVDIRGKSKSIPANIKRKLNNALHDLGNYHVKIPNEQIFNICKQNGVVPLQEDGTEWSGFLLGNAECGSEKAKNQRVNFELAFKTEEGIYIPANNVLSLSWCTMNSGKYEVVCYIG